MKKLALAGLAFVASTLMAAASVDTFDIHAPPAFAASADADLTMLTPDEAGAVEQYAAVEGDAMLVGHIEGATRVIGKSQGYLGLPIRDVAINCSVNGEETPAMVTAWHPTPDELEALMNGAPIHVQLLGQSHPPIMVGVGPVPDEA